MPSKLRRLIKEARETAIWRGHEMEHFTHFRKGVGWNAFSHCLKCNAWVQIETNPLPNSIDIGGSAVAINCGQDQ